PDVWYAVRDGKRYQLELKRATEDLPRCYAFIPPSPGQPKVRLAVGHYWGVSIYELDDSGAKRVQVCTGHTGEVTGIGVSPDATWLVPSSTDMTICAWNLNQKWKHHPVLGAAFEVRGGKLVVTAVDTGSPAWEAGFLEGDEVVDYKLGTTPVPGGPEG